VGKLWPQQQLQALERKMDFAVLQIWYGKVPAELTSTSTSKREEEEEEEKWVLAACPSWAV
jgi:hypothetical protein